MTRRENLTVPISKKRKHEEYAYYDDLKILRNVVQRHRYCSKGECLRNFKRMTSIIYRLNIFY